jgi:hypothetical protein
MDVSLENASQPTEAQPHSVVIRLGEGHIASLIRTTYFSKEDFSDQGITTEHADAILAAGGIRATHLLSFMDQELALHQAVIFSSSDVINSLRDTNQYDEKQKQLLTTHQEAKIVREKAILAQLRSDILELIKPHAGKLSIDPQNQKYMENIKNRIA